MTQEFMLGDMVEIDMPCSPRFHGRVSAIFDIAVVTENKKMYKLHVDADALWFCDEELVKVDKTCEK